MPSATKPEIWHARFRGLKIAGDFSNNVLPGMFEIELRPARGMPFLFTLHLVGNPTPFSTRPRTLHTAKEHARSYFVEQITEWRPADRG